jgi:hypothetical protein
VLAHGLVQRRRVQGRAHPLSQHGAALSRLARDRLGAVGQHPDQLALPRHRRAQLGPVAAGQQGVVRGAQPLAGNQQVVGLGTPPSHRLVQRPGAGRRLAQRLDPVRRLPVARGAHALRRGAALGHELVEREPVELVDLSLDVHARSAHSHPAARRHRRYRRLTRAPAWGTFRRLHATAPPR